jgi:SAM-dependent methyltransferase
MATSLFGGGEFYCLSNSCSTDPNFYFQMRFRDHVLAEPGLRGEVLDIGCGADIPTYLVELCTRCQAMDGVDPDSAMLAHPRLRTRWNLSLEQAPIPDAKYDLAFACTVMEHIAQPRAFFHHVRRVLKPGGVFWALTPHSRHLFTWLARGAELAGFKTNFHRHDPGVNSYSSYYRANSRRQVLHAIRGLGFKSASFYYYPGVWRQYFPRGLRWIGDSFDYLWGRRTARRMLEVAYRLEVDP